MKHHHFDFVRNSALGTVRFFMIVAGMFLTVTALHAQVETPAPIPTVPDTMSESIAEEESAAPEIVMPANMPDPNDFVAPKITSFKGGFFFEWPSLTTIGAIELARPYPGNFEIQFDLRMADIGQKPQPVSKPEVIVPLADYWIVRGKPERAIPLYRLGLQTDPGNLLFLNNVAMLLSTVEGKHGEALGVIDNALEDRRDNVTLLDTKGLILMKDNRPDEAIPNLERAVELSCQLPIYCLHLAKALDMAGRENSARNWFDKARPLLEAAPVKMTRDNQNMFDQLRMKYGSPAANE